MMRLATRDRGALFEVRARAQSPRRFAQHRAQLGAKQTQPYIHLNRLFMHAHNCYTGRGMVWTACGSI
jgi:hypothetical protein